MNNNRVDTNFEAIFPSIIESRDFLDDLSHNSNTIYCKNGLFSDFRKFCVHELAFAFSFAFIRSERRSSLRSKILERVRERRSFERRSPMLWIIESFQREK